VIQILVGLAIILAAVLRRPRRRQWAGPPPISGADIECFEVEIAVCDDRLVGVLEDESETSP
jgi:hypothetical protein